MNCTESATIPVPSVQGPLTDVVILLTPTPDDGQWITEVYDCYPWELANLLPALERIRRRSWWPWAAVKHLTIISRNGKRTTVFGDRIVSVTTRPARGGTA